jgi:hypothetical protein
MTMPIGKNARIRLLHTDDPYTRLRPGDEGTIDDITDVTEVAGLPFKTTLRQIWVKWDSGSSLALLEGKDAFEYWWPYLPFHNAVEK